jgi:hypothetical protein
MAAALEATPWSATSPEPQDTALRGLQPATSRRTDCVVHPGTLIRAFAERPGCPLRCALGSSTGD